MANFQKNRAGPSKSLASKYRLSSNSNFEVEGFDVAFVFKKRNKIQDFKLKFYMAPLKTFNLLIQEKYDAKRLEQDL
jgi:hypothetical protein